MANRRFYAAFTERDVATMDGLWARDHTVACTHPGSEPLHGRGAVLQSFAVIFASPGSPRLQAAHERVVARTETSALVTCTEHAGEVEIVATNGFVLEAGAWVMVLHHASPVVRQRSSQPPPSTLN